MTDILNHDWILKNTQDFQRCQYYAPSRDQLKDNTLKFKKYSLFKQMSIRQLVRMLDSTHFQSLYSPFFNQDDGGSSYLDFLCENLDLEAHLTDTKIKAIFKSFDIKNQESITLDNIKAALTKFGLELQHDDAVTLFQEIGKDESSEISFDEFKRIIQ